jgi:hypothetical protein
MSAMIDPVLEQEAFRFGDNTGTESTHGWLANQSIDITAGSGLDVEIAAPFLLRIRIAETAGATSTVNNVDVELQVNNTGAGWTAVTTTSTNGIQAVASTPTTNGNDTTERLTGGATNFDTSNAGQSEDGTSGGANLDIAGDDFSEHLFAIQVVDANVSNGDTLDFRITRDGGTLMDNEATADEPRVTVTKANIIGGDGAATGLSTLDADGRSTVASATSTTGLSTLDFDATTVIGGDGASTGLSTLDASGAAIEGEDIQAGSPSTTGLSTLDATGITQKVSDISASGNSTLDAAGTSTNASDVSITGSSTLDTAGTAVRTGTAAATGDSALDATGTATHAGNGSATGLSSLSASATGINAQTPSATGSSTLDAVGAIGLWSATATATGSSTLNATGSDAGASPTGGILYRRRRRVGRKSHRK